MLNNMDDFDKNIPTISEQRVPQELINQELENQQANTLDEPVATTIARDLKMIGQKLKYVLMPKFTAEKGAMLRNWDLWGPLMICLVISITLSIASNQNSDVVFGTVFVLIWAGAFIVTLNAKFLGGYISYLQTICVLGYCIFPIAISTCVCVCFKYVFCLAVRFILTAIAFVWASISSIAFMSTLISPDRKWLAVYPIILFYLFISWYSALV